MSLDYNHLAALGQEFFVTDKDHENIYFVSEYNRHLARLNGQSLPIYEPATEIEEDKLEHIMALFSVDPNEDPNEEVDTIWWNEDLNWHPITDPADVVSYMEEIE